MKNTTVKELIEILKEFDQDAVVCRMRGTFNGEPRFVTFEQCREFPYIEYVERNGDYVVGNIVALY